MQEEPAKKVRQQVRWKETLSSVRSYCEIEGNLTGMWRAGRRELGGMHIHEHHCVFQRSGAQAT